MWGFRAMFPCAGRYHHGGHCCGGGGGVEGNLWAVLLQLSRRHQGLHVVAAVQEVVRIGAEHGLAAVTAAVIGRIGAGACTGGVTTLLLGRRATCKHSQQTQYFCLDLCMEIQLPYLRGIRYFQVSRKIGMQSSSMSLTKTAVNVVHLLCTICAPFRFMLI